MRWPPVPMSATSNIALFDRCFLQGVELPPHTVPASQVESWSLHKNRTKYQRMAIGNNAYFPKQSVAAEGFLLVFLVISWVLQDFRVMPGVPKGT